MRKFAIFAAFSLVLAFAATAFAQTTQVNKYTVTGGTKPKTAGSKAKPKPIGIDFDFKVDEQSGLRPAVIETYAISFSGTKVNKSVAGTCSADILEDPAKGADACPKNSVIGSGYIVNATGDRAKFEDKSIACNAKLTVVNMSGNKASIYVEGSPDASSAKEKCAIPLAASIPATFKNTSSGTTLSFKVPESLKHPAASLSNAVQNVTSTIKKITKKGKGFYEATGCTGGKRTISVKFTPEGGGAAQTASKKVACS
jgi:hypothetical protein